MRDEEEPTWIEAAMEGRDVSVGAAPGMLDARSMYYTVADWEGDDGSACIGLARATGSAPFLDWEDVGEPVYCSTPESVQEGGPFAIDAAPFVDAEGRHWMAFGSHYSGIWGVELDVESGLVMEDAPMHLLATGPSTEESIETGQTGGAIEAAYVHERNGLYTLFVNWYACCMGIESTYEIRVGISDSPMGPFVDRQGVRMDEGGGTLLLKSDGRFIGPGHAGIYVHTDGREVFSFHFYDLQGTQQGGSLAMRLMEWDTDGWPKVLEQEFIP